MNEMFDRAAALAAKLNDRERLELAARLIEDAVGHLDRRVSACNHCGLNSYANWDQEQVARQLEPMKVKLLAFARSRLYSGLPLRGK